MNSNPSFWSNKCPVWNNQGEQILSLKCVPVLFGYIIEAAFVFAGIVAVVMIIVSGLKMISSGGDAKQLEGARKTLTFAIIGLVIILASFFIINIIAGLTGASCILPSNFILNKGNNGFQYCNTHSR